MVGSPRYNGGGLHGDLGTSFPRLLRAMLLARRLQERLQGQLMLMLVWMLTSPHLRLRGLHLRKLRPQGPESK